MFKPTYLYVKTHNQTGLKYFGKTTAADPYKYPGSGVLWSQHLKEHGNDVTTEIIGFFDNKEECERVARQFSADNDIKASSEWANMIPETLGGRGGSNIGERRLVNKREKDPEFDRSLREKYSTAAKGHTRQSGELNSNFGKIRITDGKTNRLLEKNDPIPDGWRLGRTQKGYSKPTGNPSWFKKK